MKKTILLMLILMMVCRLHADVETVDGVTYNYTVLSGEAMIGPGRWVGSSMSYDPAISGYKSDILTIPATLGGFPVTSIGDGAFYGCNIGDVVVPKGIKIICDRAFSCSRIKNITMPEGMLLIEGRAFESCLSLTNVTIGSVKCINNLAFKNCSFLEKLSVYGKIEDIGDIAFEGCNILKAAWQQTIANLSAEGVSGGYDETEMRNASMYNLSMVPENRAIANIEINGDSSIESFVLKDGKVFDCALRITNVSDKPAKVTMPKGYIYEKFRCTNPLVIPASSTNLLTITRTKGDTFLLSREELVLEVQE